MEQQRQLAAIMFTDIVGYTRLMGQSEQKAFAVLAKNREVQLPLIERYNGRFIKELGDGTMASFSNAYDAVRCGIEIQKASASDPDLNLRIGVHMGEVVFENNDVFGDGVNVAARIESAGRTGSVFISDAVYSAVRNKDDIETRFIEQMQLKNVNRPIDIYEVAVDGKFTDADPKSKRTKPSNIGKFVGVGVAVALALAVVFWFEMGNKSASDKQLDHVSIAVLPFENMSSDAENEFFCDGVTEDILTHLSKLKNLKVISRTSVMHFKGSELPLPEIAKKLDVEYILEGSVRKYGDQVAITAQLIHADNDDHLWAEKYQRELKDIFQIQSEVAQEITRVLNVKISMQEEEGLRTSPTNSVEAYQLFLQGKEAENKREVAGLKKAVVLYKKAIEIDPLYVEAYGYLAQSILNLQDMQYGHWDNDSCFEVSEKILDQAMAIDPNNYKVHTTWANFHGDKARTVDLENEYQQLRSKKLTAIRKAVDLNPNDGYSNYILASTLYKKDPSEAEAYYRKAVELDPVSMVVVLGFLKYLLWTHQLDEFDQHLEKSKGIFSQHFIEILEVGRINAGGDRNAAVEYKISLIDRYPNDADRYLNAADDIFFKLGDAGRARLYLDTAMSIDPSKATWVLNFMIDRHMTSAAEQLLENEEYFGELSNDSLIEVKGLIAMQKGNYEKAHELLYDLDRPTYGGIFIDSYTNLFALEYIEARLGDPEPARRIIDGPEYRASGFINAFLWLALDNKDSAYAQLETLDESKRWWAGMTLYDTRFKPFWGEKRYELFLDQHGYEPLPFHK